jgi:hypothetical protein
MTGTTKAVPRVATVKVRRAAAFGVEARVTAAARGGGVGGAAGSSARREGSA